MIDGSEDLAINISLNTTEVYAAKPRNGNGNNAGKGDGNGNNAVKDEKAPKWWSAEAIANAIVSRVVSLGIKLFSVFVLGIAFLASYITAWAVGFAVIALDIGISLNLQGFSDMMQNDIGTAIQNSWKIFRDLGNIGLVFILLYIAINTIIQAGSFQTKKLLGTTIMVAILINFSYLATTIVIDVSNIMAESIKGAIDEEIDNKGLGFWIHERTKMSTISDKALGAAGVPLLEKGGTGAFNQQIDDKKDDATFSDQVVTWATSYTLLTILNLVIIIVFLVATIMLITRVIILMFLLVLSPIGFISGILPNTKKMSDEWWGALMNNAFFMPIFLLFIYVAVEIINSEGLAQLSALANVGASSSKGTSELTTTIANIMAPLVQYGLVIGMFIGALVVSRKMSMGGGGIASKVSGSITTSIGKGAIGAGAFAGRQTIGRGADMAANSNFMQRRTGVMGTFARKQMQGVAGSNFDARGSRAFKGVASATGVGNDFGSKGKGFGDIKDGGFTKYQKDKQSNLDGYAKSVQTNLTDEEQGQVDQQKADLVTMKSSLKTAKKDGNKTVEKKLEKDIKAAQDKIHETENKNQIAYAKSQQKLADKSKGWLGKANKKSAKKMMDNLSKDKTDKRFDQIEELIKKNADKD